MEYLKEEEIKGVVGVPIEEQETSIVWMRNDNKCKVYTCDNTTVTKLKKMVAQSPDKWKCYVASMDVDGNPTGYFFECPRKAISFRNGIKHEISEERRQAAAERLKKMWAKNS